WLAPAMQALPESVERLEAPPELRQRLMSEVRADVAEAAGGRRRLADLWSGGRRRTLRPLAGLAVLALLAAAATGYVVGNDGSSEPGTAPETVVAGEAPGVVAR